MSDFECLFALNAIVIPGLNRDPTFLSVHAKPRRHEEVAQISFAASRKMILGSILAKKRDPGSSPG